MRTFLSSSTYMIRVAPIHGRTIFRKTSTRRVDANTRMRKRRPTEENPMNNIVYIVGAIVIVIAILSFLGLS